MVIADQIGACNGRGKISEPEGVGETPELTSVFGEQYSKRTLLEQAMRVIIL